MLFVFFLSLRVKLSHTEDTPHHHLLYIFENLPQEVALWICCKNLPWLFATRIYRGYCRENMPQELVVAICRGFFAFVSKSFSVYVSTSCFYESKPFFICKIFFINSVSFCYCRGSYGPPCYISTISILLNRHKAEGICNNNPNQRWSFQFSSNEDFTSKIILWFLIRRANQRVRTTNRGVL